jgi:hypothetical protein
MYIERKPNASFQTKRYFRRIIMKALIVKDLDHTVQLDRTEMTAVRGGMKMSGPAEKYCGKFGDLTYAPSDDSSITAAQSLFQVQDVVNATANGSAFLDNIHVTNDVSQNGTNKIVRR